MVKHLERLKVVKDLKAITMMMVPFLTEKPMVMIIPLLTEKPMVMVPPPIRF